MFSHSVVGFWSEGRVSVGAHQVIMKKAFVTSQLKAGDFKISKKKGRSKVWSFFGQIVDSDNVEIKDFVACRECNRVSKYNGQQTTALLRHECVQRSMAGDKPKVKVDEHERKELNKILVEIVERDLLPFSIVEGAGFRKFTAFLLNIGAKYGAGVVDIDYLLPNSSTVAWNLSKYHEENSALDLTLPAKKPNTSKIPFS